MFAIRMKLVFSLRTGALAVSMLLLAACNGSDDPDDGGCEAAPDRAPTAKAGADQAVGERARVHLAGTA